MTVLGIDTSGKTASCAVVKDGVLLAQTTVYTSLTHSQVILPFVKRLLDDTGLSAADIDLVAVANGPGSYTGLRIGISMVKGLCFDGKPCVGISTLEALAANCLCAKGIILPVMSARQNIIYFGGYESDGEKLIKIHDDCVSEIAEFNEYVSSQKGDIILTGDCAEKLKSELFADNPSVRIAPAASRLQQAAGVCQAAVRHLNEALDCDRLRARYLQITKAEKDLKEKMQCFKK